MNATRCDARDAAARASLCRRWFGEAPVEITSLPTSGFSGSQVFVVRDPDGVRFVLKSFPYAATRAHAAWVHRLAGHLRSEGIWQVPEVITARDGDTVVVDAAGTLWELCRFVPGVAVPCPDPRQAAAVGALLARIHVAAARLPDPWQRETPSPGIVRRIAQARRLRAVPWEALGVAWRKMHGGQPRAGLAVEVARRLDAAIEAFAGAGGPRAIDDLARLEAAPLRVQPVLRDIWCDHVLHANAAAVEVTGIIDLHAAGIDTPVTDIARLLGSWGVSAGCARLSLIDRHPAAIDSYERIRPLGSAERRLVGFLHSTAVIFGLDNWFRWILEDQRDFSAGQRVLDRIDRLMLELRPALAGVAGASIDDAGIVD